MFIDILIPVAFPSNQIFSQSASKPADRQTKKLTISQINIFSTVQLAFKVQRIKWDSFPFQTTSK